MSASAVLLLVGGLWLTVFNGWTFMKGYSLGGGGGQQEVSAESKDRSAETKAASSEKQVADADAPLYPIRPKIGDEIGELSIPKLDAVLPIFHGTDEDELAKGVGHYADSVLPGEKDNAVLSGHRDTVFRKLGEVGVGDELIVTTSAGEFTYKVRKVRIVDADDRTVIVPKPRATLTVSTCYPFDFIGAAPERYILEAYLVK
ncbi:class D sortase [Oceanobacillus kapialis]|uniref:Class D sortase n=1 Tax=Oceanobacillus kapialis TaxID=481353 RepID=A0ABW5PXD8_9BACI